MAAVCFSSPADASEWWWVSGAGKSPERVVIFMDKASLVNHNSNAEAWSLLVYERARPDKGSSTRLLRRYDCIARTSTVLSILSRRDDGSSVYSGNVPLTMQTVEHVIPDSTEEEAFNFACDPGHPGHYKLNGETPEAIARTIFGEP